MSLHSREYTTETFDKKASKKIAKSFFEEFDIDAIIEDLADEENPQSQDISTKNISYREEDYDVHMQVHGLEIHLSVQNDHITHYYIFPVNAVELTDWYENFQGSRDTVGKYAAFLIGEKIAEQLIEMKESSRKVRKNTEYAVQDVLSMS